MSTHQLAIQDASQFPENLSDAKLGEMNEEATLLNTKRSKEMAPLELNNCLHQLYI